MRSCFHNILRLSRFLFAQCYYDDALSVQITHVLSLGGADMLDKLRAPLHERGLKHLCVEMSDASTQDLTGHLETCLSFMATGLAEANSNDLHGGGGVFVHCFQGKSRSAGTHQLLN